MTCAWRRHDAWTQAQREALVEHKRRVLAPKDEPKDVEHPPYPAVLVALATRVGRLFRRWRLTRL